MGKGDRYQVITMVELELKQFIIEYANRFTGGNQSEAQRQLFAIARQEVEKMDGMSASLKLACRELESAHKQYKLEQLVRGYIELQQNPSQEHENLLREFATENKLSYPPDVEQINIWDIDKNLRKTLEATRICCDGSDKTTMRDIMRVTHNSFGEEAKQLRRLKEYGLVEFITLIPNTTNEIKLC